MIGAIVAVHVALATGRVNGDSILGRNVAQVEAVFGRPVSVERYPVRRDLLFHGIEVIFGNGKTASAYVVTGVARPAALRAELSATPGLRESRRYRCDAKGCFGTFFTQNGKRRVIYGLNRGSPYLGEQAWPQP
jgi:hypothetical protein